MWYEVLKLFEMAQVTEETMDALRTTGHDESSAVVNKE